MKVSDVQEVIEREPFRPFTIRLNNGFYYTIPSRRSVGATVDYRMIFVFTESGGAVRVDADSIVEIIEGT